jgi:2-polyprenyl-6-methoxyphenol hydroxylase-like FAD-dependent oxidoreductase
METADRKAVVVGGGIGGLTAALALRRGGWEVEVYEQAPELREVGSGVMISSNATRVLKGLGLLEAVASRGVEVTQGEGCAWDGARMTDIPLGEVSRRADSPHVLIHRGALHGALAEAFGTRGLFLGARLRDFAEEGAGVVARFEDGREARGAVLVGADGLRSRVRAGLHGEAEPEYAGYPCWRGLASGTSFPNLPVGLLRETQGRGARFGMGYIRPGQVYWWATVNWPERTPVPGGDKAFLLEAFRAAHAPIPQLIAATREEDLLRSDIHDRPPLAPWGRGRVTLLGDAAHPMTPNLGQGACSAIEDGQVLASALGEGTDIPAALRAYERRRAKRTARLQRDSRLFGAIGQWENRAAVWLRERLMRMTPRSKLLRDCERIWGWQG